MRTRFLLLHLVLLATWPLFAQPTMPFTSTNYQAVVRNANGDPLPYQTVGIKFLINWGLAIAYEETQTVTTDGQGVLSTRIGEGVPTGNSAFGSFEDIRWFGATMFGLNVEMDITGGTNYLTVGGSELKCVPFAALSRQALMLADSTWVVIHGTSSAQPEPVVYTRPPYRVGIGTNVPANKLDVAGGAVVGQGFAATATAPVNGLLVEGSLGIGTTNTEGFSLLCNGTAAKPGGGSWSTASDRRLKRDIAPLQGSLDLLLRLRGVTYAYNDPASIHELGGTRIGFIAQEVEPVLPDWVEEVDGYKRLTIRGFEALAVEALRELDAENRALRAELEALRAQQAGLVQRMERIEAVLAPSAGR